MAEQRRKVKADGYVETLFGRKVNFPNANSSHPAERSFVERASINAPICRHCPAAPRRPIWKAGPQSVAAFRT